MTSWKLRKTKEVELFDAIMLRMYMIRIGNRFFLPFYNRPDCVIKRKNKKVVFLNRDVMADVMIWKYALEEKYGVAI